MHENATATSFLEQPTMLTETRAICTGRVDLAPPAIITHDFSSDFDL